jgi:hypothetical protein
MQANLFGGYDEVLSDEEKYYLKLKDSPKKEVEVTFVATVPDATESEIDELIRFDLSGGCISGVISKFEIDKVKDVKWNFKKEV